MAPFPVYDTEYVKDIKNRIMELENSKEDYDALPVDCCKHCKTLVVPNCFEIDDLGNEMCLRCGSVNEIQTFNNIHEYLNEGKNG